jgi:hypothetical protein
MMNGNYQHNISENISSQALPPTRRVGTFTLGLSLILLGILVPIALYLGEGWWKLLLFSPIVLLCLGVEILVYAIRYKGLKYRYDGLSIFLVLLITFVALFCAGTVKVTKTVAAYSQQIEKSRISAIKTVEKAVADNNCTANVNGNLSTSSSQIVSAMLDNDKNFTFPVTVHIDFVTINGTNSPDQEQIIQSFADVAAACVNPNLNHLSLRFYRDGTEYSIHLYDGAITNTNATDIKSRIYIHNDNE